MKRVCLFAALVAAIVAMPVGAADLPTSLELRLQTIESRLPEPGRIDALASKVHRLARNENVSLNGRADVQASGGSSDVVFKLYQKVQRLTRQFRSLRGKIQELKHKFKQRKQRQLKLYQHLNKRLKAVEQKLGLRPGQGPASSAAGGAGGGRSGPTRLSSAENAYNAAFDLLSAGKYNKARSRFEQFVKAYPHSDFTDNAWYWLGNTRFINGHYDAALKALRHVLNDFPTSGKVPAVLYKVGVIMDQQGKDALARKKLNKVIDQYPDANAAELARKRLKNMEGD